MDDALVHVSARPRRPPVLSGPAAELALRSLDALVRDHAAATLHVRVLRGRDRHHVVEAAFKALGLALRDALVDAGAVFSTKGAVSTGGASVLTAPRDRVPRRAGRPRREGRAVRGAARRRRSRSSWRRGTRPRAPTRSCSSTSRRAPRSARHAARRRATHRGAAVHSAHDRRRHPHGRRRRRARCAPAPTRSSINTAAVARPELLSECAERFGVAVRRRQHRRAARGTRLARVHARRRAPPRARRGGVGAECVRRGAGEILLTSIDRDGARDGYDLELTRAVADAVRRSGDRLGRRGHRADDGRRALAAAAPTPRSSPASCTTAPRPSRRSRTRSRVRASPCGGPRMTDRAPIDGAHAGRGASVGAARAASSALALLPHGARRRDQGRRHAGDRGRPRAPSRRRASGSPSAFPTTASSARSSARRRRRGAPLDHRSDRRHQELRARRPAVGNAGRGRGGDDVLAGAVVLPGGRRDGRRRARGGVLVERRARAVSAIADLAEATVLTTERALPRRRRSARARGTSSRARARDARARGATATATCWSRPAAPR